LLSYRGGGPPEVCGGEQVEKGAAQDSEHQGPLRLARGCVPLVGRLSGGQDGDPVLDSGAGETGPRAAGLDEGAGVSVDPERQQRPVLLGGQPGPDPLGCIRGSALP